MCLLVVKDNPKGKFTVENFDASYSRNSDGMGIMWVEKGRVKVERMLGSLKNQRTVFLRHMNRPQWVMHQRFKTHGLADLANCHPYKILSIDDNDPVDLYMAHNGVISGAKTTDKSMSDTWNFIENYIKPILKINHTLIDSEPFQMMINNFIGSGNKLATLDNSGNILIFHKHIGTVLNGCWLSNTHSIHAPVNKNWFGRDYHDNEDFGEGSFGTQYSGIPRPRKTYEDSHWYGGVKYETLEEMIQAKNRALFPGMLPMVTREPEKKTTLLLDSAGEEIKPITKLKDMTKEDKKDLIEDKKADILTQTELEKHFTQEELDELNVEIEEEEIKQLSAMIAEIYDPTNVDRVQMQALVEKCSKDLLYKDLELLVDYEPQVAADMLEFLLEHFVDSELLLSNNPKVKVA